ncbi:hypothetical protein pb186bvf_007245 [Paramecium bursaria]
MVKMGNSQHHNFKEQLSLNRNLIWNHCFYLNYLFDLSCQNYNLLKKYKMMYQEFQASNIINNDHIKQTHIQIGIIQNMIQFLKQDLMIDFQYSELNIHQPIYRLEEDHLLWLDNKIQLFDLFFEVNRFQVPEMNNVMSINFFNDCLNITVYGYKSDIETWVQFIKVRCFQKNVLKNHKMVQKLGKGSFGEVYKAIDLSNNKKYAIKVMKMEKYDQILQEIKILRRLNHESCIKIHEIYKDEYVWLKLDYIKGGELLQFLAAQKQILDERSIRDIMQTLFEGLEYIHSIGIIHRDIKPQNILMRSRHNSVDLVICDFGLATQFQKLNQSCGTPGFIAPEMLRGELYDYKVDVYSLGVLLYLLITGKYPFESNNTMEKLNKNYDAIYDFNTLLKSTNISSEGIYFITQCLQSNPTFRITSKEALRHEWFMKKDLRSQFSLSSQSFEQILVKIQKDEIQSSLGYFYELQMKDMNEEDDDSDLTPLVQSYQMTPKLLIKSKKKKEE